MVPGIAYASSLNVQDGSTYNVDAANQRGDVAQRPAHRGSSAATTAMCSLSMTTLPPHAGVVGGAAQLQQAAAACSEPSCGMGLLAASTVSFSEAEAGGNSATTGTNSLFPSRTDDSDLIRVGSPGDGPVHRSVTALPTATDIFNGLYNSGQNAALFWDVMASCPASPAWDQPMSPTKRPAVPQCLASGVNQGRGGLNLQDLEDEFLSRVLSPAAATEAGILRAGMRPPACKPRSSSSVSNLASMLALTPAGASAMRAARSGGSFSSAMRLVSSRDSQRRSSGDGNIPSPLSAAGGSQRVSMNDEFTSGESRGVGP